MRLGSCAGSNGNASVTGDARPLRVARSVAAALEGRHLVPRASRARVEGAAPYDKIHEFPLLWLSSQRKNDQDENRGNHQTESTRHSSHSVLLPVEYPDS